MARYINFQTEDFHRQHYNKINFNLNLPTHSWLRYATRIQRKTFNTDVGPIRLWIARMPKGYQVCHGSKSVTMTHAQYPLRYTDFSGSREEWKRETFEACQNDDFDFTFADLMEGTPPCYTVSLYSLPNFGGEYASPPPSMFNDPNPDNKFAVSTLDAYGYSRNFQINMTDLDTVRNIVGNKRVTLDGRGFVSDRSNNIRDITNWEDRTFLCYALTEDTDFIISATDAVRVSGYTWGRDNMRELKRYFEAKGYFRNNNLLHRLYDFAFGTSTLYEQIEVFYEWCSYKEGCTNYFQEQITTKLRDDFDIDPVQLEDYRSSWIYNFYILSILYYNLHIGQNDYTSEQAREITSIATRIQSNPRNAPRLSFGFRWSTFETDPPVFNLVYQFITNSNVAGFIGDAIYRPQADLRTNDPAYYFHPEMGIFYAPDYLTRTKSSPFDVDYGMNYLGLLEEMRKYKTRNIMQQRDGSIINFHQGHLFEHSIWVALYADYIMESGQSIAQFIQDYHLTVFVAAFLHDIGKAGDCKYNRYLYKNMDLLDLTHSWCSDRDERHFEYYEIADHPEVSYEYLKGLKKFKKYYITEDRSGNNFRLSLNNFDEMFRRLGLSDQDKKLVRIAVGMHYDYGLISRELQNNNTEGYEYYLDRYIKKLQMFMNAEFNPQQLTSELWRTALLICLLVSLADIIGSEYYRLAPKSILQDRIEICDTDCRNAATWIRGYLTNTLPNTTVLQTKPLVEQSQRNIGVIAQALIGRLTTVSTSLRNNYNTYYYLKTGDIPYAITAYYNWVPKIIIFDLDATLIERWTLEGGVTYYYYPDAIAALDMLQQYRKVLKIAIASRHYLPSVLYQRMSDPNDALHISKFDFGVVKYTGTFVEVDAERYRPFFIQEGFVFWNKGNNVVSGSEYFAGNELIQSSSKELHFRTILDLANREGTYTFDDFLLFDDDPRYLDAGVPAAQIAFQRNGQVENHLTPELVRSAILLRTFQRVAWDE